MRAISILLLSLSFTRQSLVEKKADSLFYRPYGYFAQQLESSKELPGDSELAEIQTLIRSRNYYQARLQAKGLVAHTLEGLRYLQTCGVHLHRSSVQSRLTNTIQI